MAPEKQETGVERKEQDTSGKSESGPKDGEKKEELKSTYKDEEFLKASERPAREQGRFQSLEIPAGYTTVKKTNVVIESYRGDQAVDPSDKEEWPKLRGPFAYAVAITLSGEGKPDKVIPVEFKMPEGYRLENFQGQLRLKGYSQGKDVKAASAFAIIVPLIDSHGIYFHPTLGTLKPDIRQIRRDWDGAGPLSFEFILSRALGPDGEWVSGTPLERE